MASDRKRRRQDEKKEDRGRRRQDRVREGRGRTMRIDFEKVVIMLLCQLCYYRFPLFLLHDPWRHRQGQNQVCRGLHP